MKQSNNYKCIIIDDELHCQNALKRALDSHCPQVQVLASFDNIQTARHGIENHFPNLIFLDVEMPGGNGFELIDQLRSDIDIHIIFTTAHESYALNALKHRAADYLLKPIYGPDLQESLSKISRYKMTTDVKQQSKISLPTLNGFVRILKDDIIRCEASGAYTKVITLTKVHLISRSIGYMEGLLMDKNFFRVHKSHMVNMNHIEEYVKGNGGTLILSDESHVHISKRKREDFLLALHCS